MITTIIEDIKEALKETPSQLYIRLIRERLDLALVSYYHDISLSSNYYENLSEKKDILKVVKKVIK